MKMEEKKLDNPVWYSLNENHKGLSLDYDGVLFYKPAYCPFGGFVNLENTAQAITHYAALTNSFYSVGEKPKFGNQVLLHKNLKCKQMLLKKSNPMAIAEHIIPLTSSLQQTDLFHLVNRVQPGYFTNKTTDLGDYFGIYKNKELVAVTGERMKMNAYTEVSAVITHPDHCGKGYAKQLLKHTTSKILKEGKTPYLHVAVTNNAAITLYEKLGFVSRRTISFWHLKVIV